MFQRCRWCGRILHPTHCGILPAHKVPVRAKGDGAQPLTGIDQPWCYGTGKYGNPLHDRDTEDEADSTFRWLL